MCTWCIFISKQMFSHLILQWNSVYCQNVIFGNHLWMPTDCSNIRVGVNILTYLLKGLEGALSQCASLCSIYFAVATSICFRVPIHFQPGPSICEVFSLTFDPKLLWPQWGEMLYLLFLIPHHVGNFLTQWRMGGFYPCGTVCGNQSFCTHTTVVIEFTGLWV